MTNISPLGGDYIVGWKIRLVVRLEEYGNVDPTRDLAANPIVPPQTMRGVVSTRSQATYSQAPGGGYLVGFQGGTATSQNGPQGVDGSSDNKTFCIGGIIPRAFKLGLNGFKSPDTMTCDVRFVDIPFDPLCFRSVGIELYVGTIDPDDYTNGMAGATRQAAAGAGIQNEPLNIVPDGFVGPEGQQRSNLRFQGFVDEWNIDGDEDKLTMVHLTCTDNTRLMIDQPMPPGLRASTTLPVDQAVAQLLANFPQFAGLTVEYRPALPMTPILGPAFGDFAQLPDGLQASHGGGEHQTISVWDYLVELANCIGHNIRVEGTTVVIQRVRAAVGKNFPARSDDPFTGRTWGGSNHPLRTFIQGWNCKAFKKGRRYARTDTNVEVRSFNPHTKSTMIARFPPFANSQGIGGSSGNPNASTNRIVHALPGDGRQETKYTVFPVPGVTDQATLQNLAQAYYEGINRSALMVNVHTKDLASFGGDWTDPDVLDMLAGDRFEYLASFFNPNASDGIVMNDLAIIEDALLQSTVGYARLTEAGFDSAFIAAYLATYAATGFQTTYVVKVINVSGDVSDEAGIEIEIEGLNMIEARIDAPGVADFADSTLGSQGTTAPTGTSQPQGGP
jgi:hypothetical protein